MADNVFGDPNRQYGIPGIDNQVPGSAAQAAGVSAYRQTYKSSGDTGAATQAAVNAAAQSIQNNPANIPAGGMTAAQQLTVAEAKAGTTQPTSAGVSPSLIQAAWIEGLLGNNGTQSAAPVTTTAPASSAKTIVASDGQTLAGQDAATQSMFEAAYGAMAAQQWASQHNSALLGQGAAGSSTNITLPGISVSGGGSQGSSGTGTTGTGAATAVPASLDASLAGLTGWVQMHPLEAAAGAVVMMMLFGGKRR